MTSHSQDEDSTKSGHFTGVFWRQRFCAAKLNLLFQAGKLGTKTFVENCQPLWE
jgi:hypothetical protein